MSTDKDRRTNWQAVAMQAAWAECEKDLLLFVSSENDAMVRAGRMDVYVYIRDSIIGTAGEET